MFHSAETACVEDSEAAGGGEQERSIERGDLMGECGEREEGAEGGDGYEAFCGEGLVCGVEDVHRGVLEGVSGCVMVVRFG